LGLGLPGAKRLVSEFEIKSTVGEGTTVSIIKWKNG
jgi:serine/threonine-protein kinase RsbT